jgi:hypothetical protein
MICNLCIVDYLDIFKFLATPEEPMSDSLSLEVHL